MTNECSTDNYWPREGDTVRVTFEAKVTNASDGLHRHFTVEDGTVVGTRVASVELVKSRSLPPGSVVLLDGGRYVVMVKDAKNSVATNIKTGHQFNNPGVGGDILAGPEYKVIYEPGA